MSNFISSSKKNPCPVCDRTKDGDCRTIELGNVVMCHTQQADTGKIENGYRFVKKSEKGAGWGIWAWNIQEKTDKPLKSYRPKTERLQTFEYPDRAGNNLIRVCRQKGKSPEFWQQYFVDGRWKNAGDTSDAVKVAMKKAVPVYRYAEVRAAIDRGEPVIWVEGETCCDALWTLGIAATTSIGGANGYTSWGDYSQDLKGAKFLAVMPDRDQKGMDYARQVAEAQNIRCLIKPFPKSVLWSIDLPPDGGLDAVDWIADGATKDDVLEQIEINTSVDTTQRAAQVSNAVIAKDLKSRVLSVATSKEKDQFSLLQEMSSTSFDPFMMLPTTLATDVKHDSALFSIDPVVIWVYLMPAVASLMGVTEINFGGWKVPNIIWSAIAQKSGRGKTRAMKLVINPLWDMEREAKARFDEEDKAYKKLLKESAQNGEEEPERPKRKKHLFNIATTQAVVKRLGDQGSGVLWARDELKGAFAFDQYVNGQGEGMETMLETWDGGASMVDRVNTDDSFMVPESRLSVGGGFQPKMAKKMFDPEDPQGFTARMLIATAPDLPYVRVKGYPALEGKLPDLYEWIQSNNWEGLTGTVEADDLFTTIAEYFNNAPAPNDGIDFWQKKAAGNCLRVAGVLHVLECYYDAGKNKKLITRDTLMRAYYYVSLCRRWVYTIQGQMADSEGVSTLMQKILDKTEAMGGSATLADLYRNINAIRKLAKDENKGVAEITEGLCRDLESMGLGEVLPNEKGTIEFRKTSTLNTPKPETLEPPSIDICVDESPYQHTVNTQHTGVKEEKEVDIPNTPSSTNGRSPQPSTNFWEFSPTTSTPTATIAEPLPVGTKVTVLEGEYQGTTPTVIEVIVEGDEVAYLVEKTYSQNPSDGYTAVLPAADVRRWQATDQKSQF